VHYLENGQHDASQLHKTFLNNKNKTLVTLVHTISDVMMVMYDNLSADHIDTCLSALQAMYNTAKRINESDLINESDPQKKLQKAPARATLPLQGLLKLERSSVTACLDVLFKMYAELGEEREQWRVFAEGKLMPLCHEMLE